MNHIQHLYSQLYMRLKSSALDVLLERQDLSDYERQALRILVGLPHSVEATLDEIISICRECRAGYLEFAYTTEEIGNLAGEILELATQVESITETSEKEEYSLEPPKPTQYNNRELGKMLDWNNRMMTHLNFSMSSLHQKTDITLKAQCPYCHDDLVQIVFDNPSTGKKELRLRCKQQSQASCRAYDWHITDITRV